MAKDIHNAAGYGSSKEVSRFLKKGASVDARDAEGGTPLGRAARFDHLEVAELLVANGASIEQQDDLGRTPLHLAAALGSESVLRYLIGNRANIEATEKRG